MSIHYCILDINMILLVYMRTSIIIPTCFDGSKYLVESLPILKKEPNTEIIVIDNDSRDDTEQTCKTFDVRYHKNPVNMGFSIANNQGVRMATGEYLLFMNNDIFPLESGFVDVMIDRMEHACAPFMGPSNNAVVGVKIVKYDNTNVLQHAGVSFNADGFPFERYAGMAAGVPEANKEEKIIAVTAACMMVKSKVYEEVGGFYEGFRNGWEDNDLNLRIQEKGYSIIYTPKVTMKHKHMASPGRMDHENFNVHLYRMRWVETGKVFPLIKL